jgi:transposase
MGCTHVAMEATGVYWKPVWNILSDGDFELVLANAAHIKNVPGRKSDVSDAAWIADLLAHGLIRSSFVPEQEIQELRELLRTRKQLTRQQSRHILRLQKTLEGANIKLDSVITDIVGKSGRAMIQALIGGETDPVKLAALADRRIKASPQELREALHGRVTDHHRFLLHLHLQHIEFADVAIQDIDRNVTALITRMDQEVEAGQIRATFQSLISLLMTIPGIDVLSARIILSAIGRAMFAKRRPLAQDLAGPMCPGGCTQERQLLQCTIPPPSRAPRSKEGDLCGCGLSAHDRLPHAQGRHAISGPRCGPFRSPLQRREGQAPGCSARKPWLRCQAHSLRPNGLRLLPCCNRNADQATPS